MPNFTNGYIVQSVKQFRKKLAVKDVIISKTTL